MAEFVPHLLGNKGELKLENLKPILQNAKKLTKNGYYFAGIPALPSETESGKFTPSTNNPSFDIIFVKKVEGGGFSITTVDFTVNTVKTAIVAKIATAGRKIKSLVSAI